MDLVRWEIPVVESNCYESILENIGIAYGVRHKLRHLDSFGFECSHDIQSSSFEAMNIWYNREGENIALKKICGIKRRIVTPNEKIFSICKSQLNEEICKPIGVTINGFYLPWTNVYGKRYRGHSFLLTYFGEEKYWGVDSIVTNEIVSLNQEILHKYATLIMFFDYNPESITIFSINQIIDFLKKLCRDKRENHISQLLLFREILKEKSKYVSRISEEEMMYSKLMLCLSNIAWSRFVFAQSLEIILNEKHSANLEKNIQSIYELNENWKNAKNLMIKYLAYPERIGIEKLCSIMATIIAKEEMIYTNIESL
ncbi:MAG: hypothetical protein FWG91_04315 [Lachnospiraceae bacterium]|nr:hypothetical protein [Lachnospiraceae bacterium]